MKKPFPFFRRYLASLALLLLRWNAAAHPLGQESVDRSARLVVTPGKIIVVYDLNMAEGASARELPVLDANHDGTCDDAEKRAYASDLARKTAAKLTLEVNGQPLALIPVTPKGFLSPGEGGLPTLRLVTTLETAPGELARTLQGSGVQTASFRDDNAPDQIGWRQIGVEGLGTVISEPTVNGHPATVSAQAYLTDTHEEQTAARQTSFHFALPAKDGWPAPSPSPVNRSLTGR